MTIHIINKHNPKHLASLIMDNDSADTLFTVYCGRGSPLGNPYILSDTWDRDFVCDQYEKYFDQTVNLLKDPAMMEQLDLIKTAAEKGDVFLSCYCAPKRCHCETIKEYCDG